MHDDDQNDDDDDDDGGGMQQESHALHSNLQRKSQSTHNACPHIFWPRAPAIVLHSGVACQ